MSESYPDEAADLSDRALPLPGNSKVVHIHGNGSSKLVWAWACGTTGILVAIIGCVALYFASQQARTNERVAEALLALSVKVGQLETAIDRLEREQ